MSFKLTIEVAPPDWIFSNYSLSSCLTKRVWESIRQLVLQKYQFKCALCEIDEKGLNCHEVWSYSKADETRKLVEVLPLCRMCHAVKHMDMPRFLEFVGFEKMKDHFMRVNGCSLEEFNEYYQQHEKKTKKLVSVVGGIGHLIVWKTDFGEFTSIVGQPSNLKRGYEWEEGYMMNNTNPKSSKKL